MEELKEMAKLNPKEHSKAKETLEKLLPSPGIALPMASTILRFLNPKVFQIIDDRAYRVLLPNNTKYQAKPSKITNNYIKKTIDIYFEYLDKLHEIASEKLPFEKADRILYQLDILLENKIGDKAQKDNS